MSDAKVQQKTVGSVFDLPEKSFNIVKENWQMFAVVNVLTLLAALFSFDNSDSARENKYGANSAFDIGGFASGSELAAIIGLGLAALILVLALAIFLNAMSTALEVRTSKGEKPDFNSLIDAGKKYWARLLGLTILSGLIVLGGLILLIIPGIIAIGRVAMAPYHMVDKDLGIMDSLKASNEMGKTHWQAVWAAILLMIGIGLITSILGVIPVIGSLLGTIVTIFLSLVLPLRYLELK
jgi:Uncharacterised protein family (UPF0259)